MKNVIVSTLIVAILAACACFFSVRAVEETCGGMNKLIGQTQRLYEAGERLQAAACAEQMISYWRSRSSVLECILHHEAAEEIETVLLQLGADLAADGQGAFEEHMLLLERLLYRLERDERLLLSNILCAAERTG